MPSGMAATHDYAGIAANMHIKAKAEINSWEDADEFLGKTESTRQLASNVKVERDLEDTIHIVLYATRIVSYYPDGTFTVQNGGFNTPTTASRATQFSPEGYWFFHTNKKLNQEGVRLPVKKVVK